MEEAQTANLDIAAAMARIDQADAQVKIANAALLPVLDANFTATRVRTAILGGAARGGSPVSSLYNFNLTASYTLDIWGRNRATLLVRRRDRDLHPLRQGGDRAHHPGHRRQRLFQRARRAGPAAHRARELSAPRAASST